MLTEANKNKEVANAKPFLRWAGGKTWMIKHLQLLLPNLHFNNYHEPFLGGGAIYFYVRPTKSVFLSDLNSQLIDTYSCVKEDVESVISELRKFKNTEKDYYRIRATRYKGDFKNAAQFIYLNQTSFNGIYRVNLEGDYNVPYGRRKKNFFQPESLREASIALANANLFSADFSAVEKNVKSGDFVFLDPPYTVTHNNNGFVKYNQKLFSLEDQHRLRSLINFIDSKGATYVLTNAAHFQIEKIFTNKKHHKVLVDRASLIGGIHAQRGYFSEMIFSNLPLLSRKNIVSKI